MAAEKPRPNLSDVARQAGVSPATVSRVLNQTAAVRRDVKERVLAAAQALGYQSPRPAASVRLRRGMIALLIPDILNPYFTEIVRGVQEEAGQHHLLPLILDTSEDPQREKEMLHMLAGQPICGVIVLGTRIQTQDLVELRAQLSVPMVVLNRCFQMANMACIVVDLQNGTYRAARHLLDLHHTSIAFLPGPATSETSQVRRRGVEMALAEAGLELRSEWVLPSYPDVNGGFQVMSALLALPPTQRPTAVITYNDLMALGALHAIRSHHLRVPEDISVIGIDNIHMAAHANPPLTTLAPPKHRMGRMAMQLLRRMMAGEEPPESGYTLVECPLIVRESTGPAPGSNNRGAAEKPVVVTKESFSAKE
ncbi:MAG: LacI family DNA-binding transcriptional regulator [Anaerolineae bacterium]